MPELAGGTAGLPPEDVTLVTLARAARARLSATEGAAVRDETGRTYAAASVDLASLRLSAVQAAVAAALSSGAGRLESAAVVGTSAALSPGDVAVLAEVGTERTLLVAPDGTPHPHGAAASDQVTDASDHVTDASDHAVPAVRDGAP